MVGMIVSLAAVLVTPTLATGSAPEPRVAECFGRTPTIVGTDGADDLSGTPGNDIVYLGAGNDVFRGGDGNDLICGGGGKDRLYGDAGDDRISGGGGNDKLFGGPGDDLLWGDRGNDTARGQHGDDTIVGGKGKDKLLGHAGNDLLQGGAKRDTLNGGTGNDALHGQGGSDTLVGAAGNDILVGIPGNDSDDGGPGTDYCHQGDDTRSSCEQRAECVPAYGQREFMETVDGAWEPSLRTGDFTGDGLDDVLVTRSRFRSDLSFDVDLLVNDGAGGLSLGTMDHFTGDIPQTQFTAGSRTVIADFNGDGRSDVFIPDFGMDADPFPGRHNTLLLSAPGGKLRDVSSNLPRRLDGTHSAAAADVDGDGDIDIYVGNIWAELLIDPYLLLNDGTGRFTESSNALPHLTNLTQNGFTVSAFVDVNIDGAPDLVLGTAGDGINNEDSVPHSVVLLNDGAARFEMLDNALPPGPFPGPIEEIALFIATTDLNGDGYPDLVIDFTKDYQGRIIQILINNGDGTFRDETDTRLPQSNNNDEHSWGLELVDINRDGAPDIVQRTGDLDPPDPHIFINDRRGNFTPAAFALEDLGWIYYDLIDIHGDGGHDIVVSSFETTPPEHIFIMFDLGC